MNPKQAAPLVLLANDLWALPRLPLAIIKSITQAVFVLQGLFNTWTMENLNKPP